VWVVDRGDTIYVSTKMIDLITGHEIGEMVFNHWTVYYDELMNYYPGKDRFEVKDKQGYIVFSIADISSNGQIAIGISGYFNSPNSVLIYDNSDRSGGLNCISKSDKDWLKTAKVRASKIKSVFSNH
jgi:4-hydroxyphenylpyruvate dioxygenase-like putative hemolysin